MGEKRRFQRQQFECRLQIRAITMDGTHFMRNSFSNNISEMGLGITSFDFFAVSEKVYLQLFSKAWVGLLEVIGKVVWIKRLPFQNRFKIGIEFVDESEELRQKVREIMNSDTSCSQENGYEY